MNKTPDSWADVALSEVVAINPGIDKSRFSDEDELPFVPMPAVEAETGRIDTSERRPFRKVKSGFTAFSSGDVLFAKITPCMENGKMAVVPELPQGTGFGTTEFHVLRPTKAVDARLLYYFVSSASLRHEAQHNMTGAVGQKRVPKRFLEIKRFPLPPLKEQHRIVEKIETLFARIDKGEEALREVQKLLKRYRQSILKAAVTGELTREWREANQHKLEPASDLLARILETRRKNWQGRGKIKSPVTPDITNPPDLPDGWIWTSLDSLLKEFVTGPFGSALHKSDYVDNGTPLVNPINIVDGRIVPNGKKCVDEDTLKRLKRFTLQLGDVVIARRGDMGRCAAVTSNEENWLCGTGSMILRPTPAVLPEFLSLTIRSSYVVSFLETNSVGTTMKNLNQKTLLAAPIAIPTLDEQKAAIEALVLEFEKIESLTTACRTELTRSTALRQSILKSAFTGQLVPHDSNDEPASELLARIRAEREANPAKKQSKKKATRNKARAKA